MRPRPPRSVRQPTARKDRAATDRRGSGRAMIINVSFDQNVNTLPAGFVADVNAVVNFFEHQYTDNVTFNLHVGFGERNGTALGAGSLGESFFHLHHFTYAQIKTALTNDATS